MPGPAPGPAPAGGRAGIAASVRLILLLNATAIVVAALYVGQELFVPLVLAGLLAFVLAPLVRLLERARLPKVAAVLLALVIAFVVIGLLSLVVGQQVTALLDRLPEYRANVEHKWERLRSGNALVARAAEPLQQSLNQGSASALTLAEQFARPLLGPLATGAVVLVFALVMLLYSEDLRDRFVRLVGRHDLHRTIFAMNDAARRLSRYFLSQLGINTCFGVWIGAGLMLLGVPGAVLIGLVATLMRFVPFIGTFISVAPAVALAMATSPDWSVALIVLGLFAVSEAVVSQIVEPLLYGHSTGVSPAAVLVAASFWTLLWGFVGLLIATPLTVCLVVIGQNVPTLAFLDVLLGSESPLLPSETFYQRALENRSLALLPAAQEAIAGSSLADYYDRVAIPGLHLAQRDLLTDGDEQERLDPVHDQVAGLLAALYPPEDAPAAHVQPGQGAAAIYCIPARGPLDDLAATMAGQALQAAGIPARVAGNAALDARDGAGFDAARLFCLSVLDPEATVASLHYFVGVINRAAPGAALVIGLWGAQARSPLLAALRAEGGDMHVILSLSELVAYVRATAPAGPVAARAPAHA